MPKPPSPTLSPGALTGQGLSPSEGRTQGGDLPKGWIDPSKGGCDMPYAEYNAAVLRMARAALKLREAMIEARGQLLFPPHWNASNADDILREALAALGDDNAQPR